MGERCACGHPKAKHRQPDRLWAWWWGLQSRWLIGRPCTGTFKHHPGEPCSCPRWRLRWVASPVEVEADG